MKRTPLKRGGRLRPGTAKKKSGLELINFFTRFWLDTPSGDRECQSCGKKLNEPPRTYYFDHLIEKSKRPDLAMEKDNIFLCCLECHSLKTNGFPTEKHQEAINKAKERFGIS
jgi:5-methylcytosine-specific restriction endonuclease McrA